MEIQFPAKDLMHDGFGETAVLENPRKVHTDLSAQIQQAVKRDPLDLVKCVHVFDDFYRCNWWAQPVGGNTGPDVPLWGMVATQRVRKSRFLNATLVNGALVMKEIARRI